MINMPEWITAGTAVTAVVGGLFGVYTTTQNELSVQEERLNTLVEVVARIGTHQEQLSLTTVEVKERLIRDEVVSDYLQRGQITLSKNVSAMGGELRQMNDMLIKIYVHHEED